MATALFAFGCNYGQDDKQREYDLRDLKAKQKADLNTRQSAERQAKIEDAKHLDIQRDIDKRDALIASLRNRPAERVPGTPAATCSAATGIELARAHATFLVGEATESLRWQRELIACYGREDDLRSRMTAK